MMDLCGIKWKDITKEKPAHYNPVLITDGVQIAIGRYDSKYDQFDASGFSGYEWDWTFDERFCFWAEMNLKLPCMKEKGVSDAV